MKRCESCGAPTQDEELVGHTYPCMGVGRDCGLLPYLCQSINTDTPGPFDAMYSLHCWGMCRSTNWYETVSEAIEAWNLYHAKAPGVE